jgi:hypothetical protein
MRNVVFNMRQKIGGGALGTGGSLHNVMLPWYRTSVSTVHITELMYSVLRTVCILPDPACNHSIANKAE